MSVESHSSADLHRLLFDSYPDAVSVVEVLPEGNLGKFLEVNDIACHRLGYTRDELLRMSPADISTREPVFDVHALLEQLKDGRSVTIERTHVARDGRRIQTEIRTRAAMLCDRPVVISVLQDISNMALAEAALRESERRLRNSLEGATDAAWEMNIVTGEAWASPRYYEMLGYEPWEFSASFDTWVGLMHPDEREATLALFNAQVATNEKHASIEFRMRAKDGSYRWILGRGMVVERDDSGRAVRLMGTNSDVTDRRNAEDALKSTLQLMQEVVDNSAAVIYVTDVEGRFTLANRRLGEIWGAPPEEIIGKTRDAFLPAGIAAVHLANDRMAVDARKSITIEETSPEPDGLHTYLTTKAPMFAETGNVTNVLGISTDITDRKRGEEALRQVQKLESLGVLAGGVAHDFNNILTVIIGNQSMAASSLPPGSPARDSIEAAERAAQRAAELARAMLLLSGHGLFRIGPVDLNGLVTESSSLLQTLLPATARLVTDLGGGLPKVEADVEQLQRLIVALVTNGGEAIGSRPGTVTIETGMEQVADGGERYSRLNAASLEDGPYVFLQVRDDGDGMDGTTLERIFDPFFSTRFIGRGLGLPVARGIVRGHSGGIAVESATGLGTVVRVVLPVAGAGTTGGSAGGSAGG